ncbi:D-alanine--D-alanine ligase family protein [Limibacterium fermenti]|uniref:D-alanine--D-alanine ligase family protein n=1 Tax=Limibacterium fermenti TaxID=3229863 RepID=UPI003A6FE91E
MNYNVVLLHNRLSETPSADESDVLQQVGLVNEALKALGFSTVVHDIGTDLYEDIRKINRLSPAFVFNLVETVFDKSELLSIVPSLLSSFHIPYAGVRAEGLYLTTNKLLAKKRMRREGIPTPDWAMPQDEGISFAQDKKYILKPISEEGSVGLEEEAVFSGRLPAVSGPADAYFVEEFIEGREFNVSVIGRPGRFRVLPPAEMIFHDFPPGKERVLGYRAKWDEQSFEYTHTCRAFDTLSDEPELRQALETYATQCGELFELCGYFRVDFRVSKEGKPYVLEVNGNPCISPDSGFIAAAHHAGMSSVGIVREILLSSFPPDFVPVAHLQ